MEYENEDIVFIEYRNEECGPVPFSVITARKGGYSTYDFDYCDDGNLYYHNSGGGPFENRVSLGHFSEPNLKEPQMVWKAENVILICSSNENIIWTPGQIKLMGYEVAERPLDLKHLNYKNESETNPFDVSEANEGETEWCGICEKRLPIEWGNEDVCPHLFWDKYVGVWSGPGSDECDLIKYPNELWFFIKQFPIHIMADWVKNLRNSEFNLQCNSCYHPHSFRLSGDCSYFDKIEIDTSNFSEKEMMLYMTGFNWLYCLGTKTKDDNERVANLICNKLGWKS